MSPAVRFQWTAPEDGTYSFDTARSSTATALVLRRGSCDGALLACHEGQGLGRPVVKVQLRRGETVVIGVATDTRHLGGEVFLRIAQSLPDEGDACGDGSDNDADGTADCADDECRDSEVCRADACVTDELGSSLPLSHEGTSGGSGDLVGALCGGVWNGYQQDRVLRWTAPQDGVFVAHGGTRDDEVLALESCVPQAPLCPMQPNYDAPTVVKFGLRAGESILLVHQRRGFDGNDYSPEPYSLHVGAYAPEETGRCGDGVDNDADGFVDCEDTDCSGACQ